MSKEHAQKFVEQLDKDKALRLKLKEAGEHTLRIAKDQGYEFSLRELRETLKEKWGIKKDSFEDEPDFCCLSETPRF